MELTLAISSRQFWGGQIPTPKMQYGEMTIGSPATAKNILAVGATHNTVVRAPDSPLLMNELKVGHLWRDKWTALSGPSGPP